MFRLRVALCGNKIAPPWLVGPDQSSLSLAIAYPDAPSIEDADGFSAICAAEAAGAAVACAGLPARVWASHSRASKTAADSKAAATTKTRLMMIRLPRVTVVALSGQARARVLKKS